MLAMFAMVMLQAFSATASGSVPLLLGVNTALSDGPKAAQEAHAVGANSVRIDAPWDQIEHVKNRYQIPAWLEGRVDAASSLHMAPLLILEYGNHLYGGGKPHTLAYRQAFARYAAFVVKHFQGRVRLFELWNEWAGRTGGGPPGSAWDYVQLARVAYPAIKEANPDAVVLSGGIFNLTNNYTATWFHQFLAIGGLHYVDALSLHPYDFQLGPDATPATAIAQIQLIHHLATEANGGRSVDVYVSEMGYPDYTGAGGRPSAAVAGYLERFILLAAALPYVRGVWWYDLRNQGLRSDDRESNFGLAGYRYERKPQADAFTRVSRFLQSTASLSASGSHGRYRLRVKCTDGRASTLPLPPQQHLLAPLPNCHR